MEQSRTTSLPAASIDDLFRLVLVDGLITRSDGREIRYKVVRLRETSVAHERAATRQAERVVVVAGAHKLLVSDADFRLALTAQHIEAFECDRDKIPAVAIDLDVIGKLSPHDLGLIEQRVFLITLAAEVRYGNVRQEDFDAIASGTKQIDVAQSPQPMGQAPVVGAGDASPESGPAMLADYAGDAAAGAPALDAR